MTKKQLKKQIELLGEFSINGNVEIGVVLYALAGAIDLGQEDELAQHVAPWVFGKLEEYDNSKIDRFFRNE